MSRDILHKLPTKWDGVSVWVSAPAPHSCDRHGRFEGSDELDGVPISRIHVMSRYAGGQIRGYALHAGGLGVCLPCHEGPWLEMDIEVRRLLATVALLPEELAVAAGQMQLFEVAR